MHAEVQRMKDYAAAYGAQAAQRVWLSPGALARQKEVRLTCRSSMRSKVDAEQHHSSSMELPIRMLEVYMCA